MKIQKITSLWNLSDLSPLQGRSFAKVYSCMQGGRPVILKLAVDVSREATALKAFGTVKVLDQLPGALLLEKIQPGTSLASYFPERDNEAIEITVNLMTQLHKAVKPEGFPHVRNWLKVLDHHPASSLRDHLLKTSAEDVLLHGDLHHDNILLSGDTWVTIDPHGVLGEPLYEAAAFIRNPLKELREHPHKQEIINRRITQFAKLLDADEVRLRQWCFIQAILAQIWSMEDGQDAGVFEELAVCFQSCLH